MSAQRVVRIRRPRAGDFAADADATATLYLASRRAMLPDLRDPHTEAETRAWMRDTAFARYSVRLAEIDGEIIGFAARDGAWLMQLYVKPGWTGHGIGTELLEVILADAAAVSPILRLYRAQRGRSPLLRTPPFRRGGLRRRDRQRGRRAGRPLRTFDAGLIHGGVIRPDSATASERLVPRNRSFVGAIVRAGAQWSYQPGRTRISTRAPTAGAYFSTVSKVGRA